MSDEQNLHAGHRDRIKNKFIANGFDGFDDHQILEMVLYYCYSPRRDTNELAHKMIAQFGTLHNLFEASPHEISRRCKVTKHVAVLVSMVPQLAKRYGMSKWKKGARLNSSRQAAEYCKTLFVGEVNECMYLVCLSHQRNIIYAEKISEGTITQTMVYPRIIVQSALKHQAVAVIIAHNHPGGASAPSKSDLELTKQIIKALDAIDIQVDDHIIVAGDDYYSFSERKALPYWY